MMSNITCLHFGLFSNIQSQVLNAYIMRRGVWYVKWMFIIQNNLAKQKLFLMCEGKYHLIFDAVLFTGDIILALLSLIMAFKTKKHLPADEKYREYHESAVVNLTSMTTIFLSTASKIVIILFQKNHIYNGILLITALHECVWLYPVSFLLFMPKVR